MVQELFNVHYPNESHYLELKQEVVLERGYFAGKRRYAQFIVNKEGVPVEELDLKGLDLMKSNFPPLFKQFGENLIKQIMFGKSKPSIDSQILDFREYRGGNMYPTLSALERFLNNSSLFAWSNEKVKRNDKKWVNLINGKVKFNQNYRPINAHSGLHVF
jgi:hypothetical protein